MFQKRQDKSSKNDLKKSKLAESVAQAEKKTEANKRYERSKNKTGKNDDDV